MNKFSFKRGWTLVELSIALIALGILIGISIQTMKPQRALVGPFAYAGLRNLIDANQYILAKCEKAAESSTNAQVPGCDEERKLPDITGKEESIKALNGGNLYDSYCFEVANAFSIMPGKTTGTSGMNCKPDDATFLPKPGVPGKANFQATNLVAYYYLEKPWLPIERARPTEAPDTDEEMYATEGTQYKEIFIDVNGDDPPNALGEDQFPLRLYITGEVIPSHCTNANYGEGLSLSDSHCPTTGPDYNWLTNSYPFSYDLYRSYGTREDITNPTTGEVEEKRETRRLHTAVSYKEAACHSGRDILIPRKPFCGTEGSSNDFSTLDKCKGDTYETAFCVTRLSKPSSPGMFQLPI